MADVVRLVRWCAVRCMDGIIDICTEFAARRPRILVTVNLSVVQHRGGVVGKEVEMERESRGGTDMIAY